MRVQFSSRTPLVAELDERAGPRRRTTFIAELIRCALDDERRWDDIEAAMGTLRDGGHDWDDDPANWVRAQCRSEAR